MEYIEAVSVLWSSKRRLLVLQVLGSVLEDVGELHVVEVGLLDGSFAVHLIHLHTKCENLYLQLSERL